MRLIDILKKLGMTKHLTLCWEAGEPLPPGWYIGGQ